VLHDLNADPRLPFPDNSFDTVLNTVSVDYMTHPIRVFEEVGRILKPGGLFLVIFSNRMFPPKAVKVWRESNEEERLKKWIIPDNPFGCTWDNEYMYICFNDGCPYFVRGWEFMQKEGNSGSYRLMYNPEKDTCRPVPVPTARALRESIVDEQA